MTPAELERLMQQVLSAEAGETPPAQALLMQWLQQQLAGSSRESQAPDARKLRKLERANQNLRRQLGSALKFVHALAELLGACPDCFGQDPSCPQCHGRGRPGYHQPRQELVRWVTPALRRLDLPPFQPVPVGGSEPDSE